MPAHGYQFVLSSIYGCEARVSWFRPAPSASSSCLAMINVRPTQSQASTTHLLCRNALSGTPCKGVGLVLTLNCAHRQVWVGFMSRLERVETSHFTIQDLGQQGLSLMRGSAVCCNEGNQDAGSKRWLDTVKKNLDPGIIHPDFRDIC